MVSKRVKAVAARGGTLALDAQGLSLLVDHDDGLRALVAKAYSEGARVAPSAVTPLEIRRTGLRQERLRFLLSRLDAKPVSDGVVDRASLLLGTTGLDGHKCPVDAIVVATASVCAAPVHLVTSDASHIPKLCAAVVEATESRPVRIIQV